MPGSSRALSTSGQLAAGSWQSDSSTPCLLPTAHCPLPAAHCPLPAMYIELHAASAFSFLQGASLPETLVERAAALGYPALALLDADGVYGAPRFHKAATQAGLKAIIGAELTISGQRAVGSGQWAAGSGGQRASSAG